VTNTAGKRREIFGVPAVLARSECVSLARDLTELWIMTYGQAPGDLDDDLQLCARLFDPLTRGHSLRDRLSSLKPAPMHMVKSPHLTGEPLIVDAGDGTLIVGAEARLLLDLLTTIEIEDHVVISALQVATAEHRAYSLYRSWAMKRLNQVIALRSGRGKEVMQAISVGLVLALLANRSDTLDRALIQKDHATADGKQIDDAIHAGAERFAESVSRTKGNRSRSEQKLKGGYPFTEARRRLAHRLVVVSDPSSGEARLYVPAKYRDDVVTFLGRDLARRSTLTVDGLGRAFDQLIVGFRDSAVGLAERSLVFDRLADTRRLREDLLKAFVDARISSPGFEGELPLE
jgi:hypothetical protein